jgi:HAD superfamily hydrolase (TIGR01509 family)
VTVRVVLFDLMDTVLVDPYREALAAATDLAPAELFRLRDPELWPAFERGELDEAGYWAGWERAGIPFDRDAFHRVRRAGIAFVPGMDALLDGLAGRVQRVAASNYPVWIEELERQHLGGRFERVLASHHLGVRKPDPAFFARLLERIDARTEETVFVDDRDVNVAAAEDVGIVSHRFRDATGLRRWLAERGVTAVGDR